MSQPNGKPFLLKADGSHLALSPVPLGKAEAGGQFS
jgi:hypothetical protein